MKTQSNPLMGLTEDQKNKIGEQIAQKDDEFNNDWRALKEAFDCFSSKYGDAIGGFSLLRFKETCWQLNIHYQQSLLLDRNM